MDDVRWKPVEGFPNYQVSNFGEVRSRSRQLRPGVSGGYHVVSLWHGGVQKMHRVSRIVCMAFHGPPGPDQRHAAHHDGNPLNNHASNLRWATVAENAADKARHGTDSQGARNANSKLTDHAVRSIRARYVAGGITQKSLGLEYGINQPAISMVISGANWGHVQ